MNPLAERRADALEEAITRSLRMKARVVAQDPSETTGARFALNLGHTAGHALETASRHRLGHGEAVAWGLLAALDLSVRDAGLDPEIAETLSLTTLRLVTPRFPSREALAGWRDALVHDKKADRNGLRAVLLSLQRTVAAVIVWDQLTREEREAVAGPWAIVVDQALTAA